jgi:hypothetical protein
MNDMARLVSLVLLIGLAGCATGVPVEQSVVVPGGRFDSVRGEANLVVRTFLPDEGDQRREVLGAICDVTTSLYSTRLTTPSRLVLPNFGPQSPVLGITCRAEDLTGSVQQPIVTRWRYPPGYPARYPLGPYYFGYPGMAWGWGWDPGWGAAYPVSDYPDVRVVLR